MLDELEDVLHVRGPRDRDEDAVVQGGSLRDIFVNYTISYIWPYM
jgi:hypothetical protein